MLWPLLLFDVSENSYQVGAQVQMHATKKTP